MVLDSELRSSVSTMKKTFSREHPSTFPFESHLYLHGKQPFLPVLARYPIIDQPREGSSDSVCLVTRGASHSGTSGRKQRSRYRDACVPSESESVGRDANSQPVLRPSSPRLRRKVATLLSRERGLETGARGNATARANNVRW